VSQESVVATSSEVLRPFGHLYSRGIVAILALTLPLFAVVYWLTVPSGNWPIVLAVQIVVIVVSVLAVFAFFGTTIKLDSEGVLERGFLGHVTSVRPEQVRSIMLIDIYQNSTLETTPQLFVTAHDGGLLLRMRGQFWPVESMQRVAERLDVPITASSESVTMSELRRKSPELLYWFERFPRVWRP
jgi:hypothetical protein